MFAQTLSIVLVNTFSWLGGQGYCAYDFALSENDKAYANVEIVLRPAFDPSSTATGNTELDDVLITVAELGGSRAVSTAKAQVETDCAITGLTIIKATATEDGRAIDLLATGAVSIETYRPLPILLDSK